jgi:hypothetical protein
MKHLSLKLEKGELTWIPKTVIFEGKEYPAPLDLLPILYRRVIYDYLKNK